MGHMHPSSTRSGDAAVVILVSAPSILAKIAPSVMSDEGDGRRIDWARVATVAAERVWTGSDRAFLQICAEVAGQPVDSENGRVTFGARWDALDGQRQALIASVLSESAQSTVSDELSVLDRLGGTTPAAVPRTVTAIRVRLGPDSPAVSNDALGRARVGFREGLSIHEAWLRGRGVWRMQADRVVSSPYLLIAHLGTVRLVGTIDGLTIHGDRVAIIGRPLGDHPLIGSPDPLDNASQNPVAYGEIEDVS